jgi:hypothetical protein
MQYLEKCSELETALVTHLVAKLQGPHWTEMEFNAMSVVLTEARARLYKVEAQLREIRGETWATNLCVVCGGSRYSHTCPYVPCAACYKPV